MTLNIVLAALIAIVAALVFAGLRGWTHHRRRAIVNLGAGLVIAGFGAVILGPYGDPRRFVAAALSDEAGVVIAELDAMQAALAGERARRRDIEVGEHAMLDQIEHEVTVLQRHFQEGSGRPAASATAARSDVPDVRGKAIVAQLKELQRLVATQAKLN